MVDMTSMIKLPLSSTATESQQKHSKRTTDNWSCSYEALSPSMPPSGHVRSILSSWESGNKTLSEGTPTSTKIQTDVSADDQENERNANNVVRLPSFGRNDETMKFTAHNGKLRTSSTANEFTKDTTLTNNDRYDQDQDALSLSSDSYQKPFEKPNLSISDFSTPSTVSLNHFNCKFKYQTDKDGDEAYGRNIYLYKKSKSSDVCKLDRKLIFERNAINPYPSSDSSTLNYSLGKLSEDNDEVSDQSKEPENALKPSSKHLTKDTNAVQPFRPNSSFIDSDKKANEVVELDTNSKTNASKTSDLLISSPSSSLNSVGNFAKMYDLMKIAPVSDERSEIDPSDLVASTLAECRLLLEMSPPPTPAVAKGRSSKSLKKKFGEEYVIDKSHFVTSVNVISTTSTNDPTKIVPNLMQHLRCPCCFKEFQEDGCHKPLHSFACDHIICHACVSQGTLNSPMHSTLVACPACGEKSAFDKVNPVISRGYCNLVKSMEEFNSMSNDILNNHMNESKSDNHDDLPIDACQTSPLNHAGDVTISTDREVTSFNRENAFEGKEVFSRCHHATIVDIDTISPNNLDYSTNKINVSVKQEINDVFPMEPATPVSRAEFRLHQRQEKLSESLKKVNKILERSKMNKNNIYNKEVDDMMSFPSKKEDDRNIEELERKRVLDIVPSDSENTTSSSLVRDVDQVLKQYMNKKQHDKEVEEISVNKEAIPYELDETMHSFSKAEDARYFEKNEQEKAFGVNQSDSSKVLSSIKADNVNDFFRHNIEISEIEIVDDSKKCNVSKDESVSSSSQSKSGLIKRLKTELHIDTGMHSNFQGCTHDGISHKNESSDSHNTISQCASANAKSDEDYNPFSQEEFCQTGVKESVKDVFRLNSSPRLLEFDLVANSFFSQGSSLTEKDDDNLLLLCEHAPCKSGGVALKNKYKNCITNSVEKPRKDIQKISDDHRCPQFLPSWTYSTMVESNEFAGLVPQKESPMWERNTPMYDFSQHSCSFSEPNDGRLFSGAIVTYKPMFHKKVLSKFVFRKGKKERKERKHGKKL